MNDFTVQLEGRDYSYGSDGAANMDAKNDIEGAIYHAIDAAADRCEQYGGDIRELQRLRDDAPANAETLRRIEALYRRPSWWRRIFG